MGLYPELKSFEASQLEEEILAKWDEEKVFDRSIEIRKDAKPFVFFEGPPTANGKPGLHHMMARTIKDTFCRYRTMKGRRVERKGGWDTHGLPVEIEVEKALGLEGRHQVEEYGIEKYNAACRESVLRYKDQFDDLTVRMGYWVDLDDPYVTFQNKYIESVWAIIKRIHEKGLLFEGYKIQWYSPGSNTVLSSHEVSLGYKEIQDPSVYVRFNLVDEDNTSFLAWTTTPWTLVSNTVLAIGEDIDYAYVTFDDEENDEVLILAESCLGVLKKDYSVVKTVKGADLIGTTYQPLYPFFANEPGAEKCWKMLSADFVSTQDGTGIVHLAPAFGADDYAVALKNDLPLFNPLTRDGRFDSSVPLVEDMWFKDADKVIARDLREKGNLYRQESYLHNYPHDWRKGTPLVSYPVNSWFIRTTAIKDRMVELNKTIGWQPASIGEGRFGKWLENNVDWAISRNRYWGTPLPIWRSDKEESEYFEVIGSVAELRERCGDEIPNDDELDLHRPFVDDFTWPAPDGGTMRRVPELLDVWFDSGAMPYAQWHYPFENVDKFEESFPADFIAEGVDQTRGWFYTLHAISVLINDDVAFRNVVVNGMLQDEKGEKMSKSKGNAVEPFGTIAEHGADSVRWYMTSNASPWENLKWSERGLTSTKRKFVSTLFNTYSFFATYANIDNFTGKESDLALADRPELDRWILSRLNSLIKLTDEEYASYNATKAARGIEAFVSDLSNWYVRRSRKRFWKSESDLDKTSAYQTILLCLKTVAQLSAPISPFLADWLWRALSINQDTGDKSVHLTDYPTFDRDAIDKKLERQVEIGRTACSIVLGLRNDSKINVRQPLTKLMIADLSSDEKESVEKMRQLILDETNVKDIEFIAGSSGLIKKSAKPDFKKLGKKLGPKMKDVNIRVRAWGAEEISQLEKDGYFKLELSDGETLNLLKEEVEIGSEGIEGWLVGQQDGLTIALDTSVSNELRLEGLAREIVNRVQNLRKTKGFEVTDRIELAISGSEGIEKAIAVHGDWIKEQVLAPKLDREVVEEMSEMFELEDEHFHLTIRQSEK